MFWLVVSNQCTQKLQLKHYVTLSYKTIILKCRSATMPATTLQQTELDQNFETRLQGKRQQTNFPLRIAPQNSSNYSERQQV